MAGRPTKLTPAVHERIVEAVKAGNYIETAAGLAGIHKDTLYEWIKRGDKGEEPFRTFADALKAAECEAEDGSLQQVRATVYNWQAHAWYLERKFPAKFGRRDPDHEIRTKTLKAELDILKAKLKALEEGRNPDAQTITVVVPEVLKRDA